MGDTMRRGTDGSDHITWFLIQYPDTVDGQISVTANAAPVRLVANSNGRITLFQPNKALLHKTM